MKLHHNTRPSDGLSYAPWVQSIQEMIREENLIVPTDNEFRMYYNLNLSYEDVINKVRFKTLKSVWMELHVKYEGGEFSDTFRTSLQAKDFFKKFPELRSALDKL